MHTRRHAFRALALTGLIACLLLAGCLEFEQRFLILADGSAEISFTYSVAESQLNTLTLAQAAVETIQGRAPQNRTPARLNWMFNEETARQFFSGEGIKVERYLAFTRGERKVVQVLCVVKDLRQALATGKFGDFTLAQNPEKQWVFSMELPEAAEKASDERIAQMKTLCKGLKLKLVVQTPAEITAKLGGGKVDGQHVEWEFNLDTDDSFLRNPRPVQVVFDGQKLNWTEKAPEAPRPKE